MVLDEKANGDEEEEEDGDQEKEAEESEVDPRVEEMRGRWAARAAEGPAFLPEDSKEGEGEGEHVSVLRCTGASCVASLSAWACWGCTAAQPQASVRSHLILRLIRPM
jgi:hypothetical protein